MDKFIPATQGVSNFVTPPDLIPIVLIIDADEEVLTNCMNACQESGKIYTVYIYDSTYDEPEWLDRVKSIADYVIDSKVVNPVDYFTK